MSILVELLLKASALLGLGLLLALLVPHRLPTLRHRVLLSALLLLSALPLSVALPPLIAVPLQEEAVEPLPLSVGLTVELPEVAVPLPPERPSTAPPWLAGGYLLGVLLLLVRWLRDQHALHRLLKSARPSGLSAPFPAFLVPAPIIPMACGGVRRRILLPDQAPTWEPERREAIISHEAAHLRRHDPFWQSVTELLCAFWWFHPLVWLTAHRLRAAAEAACDRAVLDSGIAPHDYAHHLLEVAVMLKNRPVAPALARSSRLEGRVKTILAYTPAPSARFVSLGLVTASLVALPLLAARPVAQAQTPPPVSLTERKLQEEKRVAEKRALMQATEKRAREIEALKNREAALRDIELEKHKLVEDHLQAKSYAELAQLRAKKDRELDLRAAQLQPRIEALQEDLEELKLKLRDLDKRLTDKRLEVVGLEAMVATGSASIATQVRQIKALEEMIDQVRQQRAKLRDELAVLRRRY